MHNRHCANQGKTAIYSYSLCFGIVFIYFLELSKNWSAFEILIGVEVVVVEEVVVYLERHTIKESIPRGV